MTKTKYTLPDLPYAHNALLPVISEEIMTLHHDKHHAGYVKGANAAIEKLEAIRQGSAEGSVKHTMKDLAFHLNGHLMHTVFWQNMRPVQEDNMPSEAFAAKLIEQFGSYDAFVAEYSAAAKSVEGSGWASLVADKAGNLFVHQVEKHNLHHLTSMTPLLVIDVWEHAYYLDYKNARGEYVENFWKIVNWEYVEDKYNKVIAAGIACDCKDLAQCVC